MLTSLRHEQIQPHSTCSTTTTTSSQNLRMNTGSAVFRRLPRKMMVSVDGYKRLLWSMMHLYADRFLPSVFGARKNGPQFTYACTQPVTTSISGTCHYSSTTFSPVRMFDKPPRNVPFSCLRSPSPSWRRNSQSAPGKTVVVPLSPVDRWRRELLCANSTWKRSPTFCGMVLLS